MDEGEVGVAEAFAGMVDADLIEELVKAFA